MNGFIKKKIHLFWIAQCVGWGATSLNAVNIVRLADALGDGLNSPLIVIILCILRAFIGIVLTSVLVRPVLRKLRRHTALVWQFTAMFLVAGLAAAIDITVSVAVLDWMAVASMDPIISDLVKGTTLARVFIYLAWGGLYLVLTYYLDVRETVVRAKELKHAAQVAKLQALQAQVNPHFLFNALNTVMSEIRNPEIAERLVVSISNYLRFSLQHDEQLRPFREELEAIASYLSVEKLRFSDRFEYSIAVDAESREYFAPTALLLPLVENAVKYGQQTSSLPLRITITGMVNDGALHVVVSNTGKWVEPQDDGRERIGIANLKRRLDLLSDRSECRIEHEEDGVVASVIFALGREVTGNLHA